MENKFDAYQRVLEKYKEVKRFRNIPPDREIPGRIDLSGNDYLGLAADSFLRLTAEEAASLSFSSSASRILAPRQNAHLDLENMLSELCGRPALLFNSGYHANVGCISALNIPGTVFLTDKLIHASVIDGLAMAGASYARWRHNDIASLKRLLLKYQDNSERMIVVAESIYSMDGDLAPLPDLIMLKREFPSMILYLDEAHAFGVRGKRGLGLSEELGLTEDVDIIIGTLGKACASSGAFVITSDLMKSFFINNSRSLIFSTALPPAVAYWTSRMIERIVKMEREREKLAVISKEFRNFIAQITGSPNPSESQIVPLMVGDASKALEIASALDKAGIDALAIRRPTVPPGGERIRFSLHASLSSAELGKVMDEIKICFAQT